LTVDPQNRRVGGRALIDQQHRLYLGHKGMLGGGRAGNMPMIEFGRKIRGFVRESISLSNEQEEEIFVIGAIDETSFTTRLRAYVTECERLRLVARQNANSNDADTENVQTDGGSGFSPEADIDGTGVSLSSDPRTIKRLHGRVVNALQKQFGNRAVNRAADDMRPDLYLTDNSGRMHTLFEVKVSSDTQSWFTALGQLVVYGAGAAPIPKRVLVCPAVRKDPNFQRALSELGVYIVIFEICDNKIVFSDLSRFKNVR
jgi:hypothetical protein